MHVPVGEEMFKAEVIVMGKQGSMQVREMVARTRFIFESFEAFTGKTVKNAVFWEVTPCGTFKNRHFGGKHGLHHQGENNQRAWKNISSKEMNKKRF
jgi:hypothetical protein